MGWVDMLGRVLRAASGVGRGLAERALDAVFGPPGLTPPLPPLPPGEHARRAVAAREAVAQLDEDEARARGETPTPVARHTADWAPASAAIDLAVHTWPGGAVGHTGDLWRAGLTVDDIVCGDVLETTKLGEAADVYCHKPARHLVQEEVNPTCEGVDADGDVRRWHRVTDGSDTSTEGAQEGEEEAG